MKRAGLRELWWRQLRVPVLVFVPVALFFAVTPTDTSLAHAFFFDVSSGWIGARSWWTNEFLHEGGRWFVRSIVAVAGCAWIGSYRRPGWAGIRRPAAYFVVTAVLAVGLVGALKMVTHVHCPWDLSEFGGRFGVPGAVLPPGRCFPAAHASSGYALLAVYFLLRERSGAWARVGLALGIGAGLVFGMAQQSRGAHFLSHDIWSAFIVWTMAVSVYTFVFKANLWNGVHSTLAGLVEHDAPGTGGAPAVGAGGRVGSARGIARETDR